MNYNLLLWDLKSSWVPVPQTCGFSDTVSAFASHFCFSPEHMLSQTLTSCLRCIVLLGTIVFLDWPFFLKNMASPVALPYVVLPQERLPFCMSYLYNSLHLPLLKCWTTLLIFRRQLLLPWPTFQYPLWGEKEMKQADSASCQFVTPGFEFFSTLSCQQN